MRPISQILSRRAAMLTLGVAVPVAILSIVILRASDPKKTGVEAHPVTGSAGSDGETVFSTEQERVRAAIDNIYRPLNGRPCEIVADFRFDVVMDGHPRSQRYRATMIADGSRIWYDSEPARYYQNDEVGVTVSTLSERIILFSSKSADRVMTEQERMTAYLSLLFDSQEHVQPTSRSISVDGTLVVFVPVSDIGRDAVGDSLRVWTDENNRLQKIDVSWPEWTHTRYISVTYVSLREVDADDPRLAGDPLANVFDKNGRPLSEYSDYVIIDRRETSGPQATGSYSEPDANLE